jgi:anti-sigma factor RsiW
MRLEDQLANYTDQLLVGQLPDELPAELEREARITRQLHAIIAPDTEMKADFRSRLNHSVMDEFEQAQRQHRQTRQTRKNILPFKLMSVQGLSAAAAILIVLVGAIAVFSDPGDDNPAPVGTTPEISIEAFAGFVVIGLVVVVGLYFFNRRQS